MPRCSVPLAIAAAVIGLCLALPQSQAQVNMRHAFEIGRVEPLDYRGRVKTIRESGDQDLVITVNAAQTNATVSTTSGAIITTVKLDSKVRTITVQETEKGQKNTSITQYDARGCPVSRKYYFPDFSSTATRTCDTQNRLLQDRNTLRRPGQAPFLDYTDIYAWSDDGRQVKIYQNRHDKEVKEETTERYNARGDQTYLLQLKGSVRKWEVETSYSYDEKGNWVQRVSKFTGYQEGQAQEPTIDVATRRLVYY